MRKDRNYDILKVDMKNYCSLDDENNDLIENALLEFYREMNEAAVEMKLTNTRFCSAHGMHHDLNYSSAGDIARLSFFCMKNAIFR